MATPVFVAGRGGDNARESKPSKSAANDLEQLDAPEPMLGAEPAAFTDGLNRFVVELPSDLVAATGSETLIGSGERNALTDLSALTGAEEIVTDASGRTWIRHGDREVTYSSSEIPAVLADLPDTEVLRVDDTHFALTTSLSEDAVSAIPGVTSVHEDVAVTLTATNDPRFGDQWALENRGDRYAQTPGDFVAGSDTRGTAAWRASRGRDVVVAVIDTGVDFSHPDLTNSRWVNPGEVCGNGIDDDGNGFADDCHGWDFYRNDSSVYDPGDHSHGTNVSGVIAATAGNGVGIAGAAPDAKIMALKVSSGSTLSFATAAAAVNYAVANGADVINASWGSAGYTNEILSAFNRARDAGVVVAIASGNSGTNNDMYPFYPASFPHTNIVSVGASTASDTRASFSNYGATSVDLFAPGWYVLTTAPGGGYSYVNGTSFSAPYVAGSLALMLARDPTLTPQAARDALIQTSVRRNQFMGRSVSGGRLDAEAAAGAVQLPVSHEFAGFDALSDLGQAGAITTAATPSALPSAPVAYRITLAMQSGNDAVGVVDEPLAYTLPDGSTGVVTTDEAGEAVLTGDGGFDPALIAQGAAQLGVATELPAGTYALVVELLELGSMNVVGQPHAVVYDVAYTGGNDGPPDPTPPPTSPPGSNPPATSPPATNAPANPTPTNPPATSPPATDAPAAPTPTAPSSPATDAPAAPTPTAPTSPEPEAPASPPPAEPPAADPPATTPETFAPTPTMPPSTVPLPAIPGTPVNFGGDTFDSAVRLTWKPGSGADPVGYRVYRNGSFVAQTSADNILLENLTNGEEYAFQVSAYSLGGESARTVAILRTPLAAPPPTSPPYTAPGSPPETDAPDETPEETPEETTPPQPETPETTPTTEAPETPAGRVEVSPNRGPDSGGTRVFISIDALDGARVTGVLFGGSAARIDYQSGSTVAVTTRPHTAGVVDVEVRAGATTMLLVGAYTFEGEPPADDPEPEPPVTSPPAPAPPATNAPTDPAPPATNAPAAPAPTAPPATNAPVPTAPPATNAPAPTSPPAVNPPATSPPATTPGAPPRQLPSGSIRAGRPLTSLPTGMWGAMTCRQSPCRGIVL